MSATSVDSGPGGRGVGPQRPDSDPRTSLTAEGISVRFLGLVAINGVDLTLRQGEILGLIGPNGAGKTTLVNVLTGFQRPTEGRVFLAGEDVTGSTPQRRARAGLARTFQGARLFADMSVIENVEVSGVGQGLSRRAARRQAVEALDLLGLRDLGMRLASDLSTGQERRLQVARAVAMGPRFLCLDEPAAGLNESESDRLLEVIRALPEKVGCGVLLIEHDMRVVMSACSRIVVLDNGQTIANGTPDEVRADSAVVEAYLGS